MEITDLIFILPILIFFWTPCLVIIVSSFRGLRRAKISQGLLGQDQITQPRRRARTSIIISVILMAAAISLALYYLYMVALAAAAHEPVELIDIFMYSPLFLSAAALILSTLWWRSSRAAPSRGQV